MSLLRPPGSTAPSTNGAAGPPAPTSSLPAPALAGGAAFNRRESLIPSFGASTATASALRPPSSGLAAPSRVPSVGNGSAATAAAAAAAAASAPPLSAQNRAPRPVTSAATAPGTGSLARPDRPRNTSAEGTASGFARSTNMSGRGPNGEPPSKRARSVGGSSSSSSAGASRTALPSGSTGAPASGMRRPGTVGVPRAVGSSTIPPRTAASLAARRAGSGTPDLPPSDASGTSGNSKSQKRALTDTSGRIADLERAVETLVNSNMQARSQSETMAARLHQATAESAELAAQVRDLQSFRDTLETTISDKDRERSAMEAELARLRADNAALQDAHRAQLRAHESEFQQQVRDLKLRVQDLTRANADVQAKLDAANQQRASLEQALQSSTANALALQATNAGLSAQITALGSKLTGTESDLSNTAAQLDAANARVADVEAKLREAETERRRLHNEIQELKGNIRVFCRVRPLLSKEAERGNMANIAFGDKGDSLELVDQQKSADGMRTVPKSFPFTFDKVFGPAATQAAVFDEIAQLVQSALDGYNVCIFAYGQTGSGKTFTMEGATGNELVASPVSTTGSGIGDLEIGNPYADDARGMIPRAVDQIFATARDLAPKGWTYAFEGTYLEIYNETLRDLLSPDVGTSDARKLEIRLTPDGKAIHVPDATVVPLRTPGAVRDMLQRAARHRSVGATLMNDRSSRSHSVFTLSLTGNNSITGEACEGRIHLVDLAGSERLGSSGATGDRLKETVAINKSLSALGDVIMALAKDAANGGDGKGHVPYRNSKLTHLLQSSLGGNSKTLMFVNVSPLAASTSETLNSLRFAAKVNKCEIGTARKNSKATGGGK
ncbi:kinesin-like nuclear fusion protein [Blastocladiella emersonii ATCC 22665]|nr:kinesin-like nuclear fusion protein [Blastocladiella emersonii ATCC 22665]